MGRIHVLPDALIDRIAAGEVVERPASVLKELVENSLDAGAGSILVRLEAGGRQEIRVTDDGGGMDRDDALLALERHATSKLGRADDLDAIRTLGFRGEALSSIAAVSKLTLQTALRDGEGTEVEVHGGTIRSVRQLGVPRGTSIRVARLFYNTPARRKFLRSPGTELSHILRWLTRYALSRPELRFRVEQGDRRLLETVPANDPRERIAQVYGRDLAARLIPFDKGTAPGRAFGFAGRAVDALARRDMQHLFVNGRAVQDRVLRHAITDAYANTMPRGRFPSIFLFLDIDPESVDVNVHPQKTEVRFRRSSEIHDLVRDAVAGALARVEAAIPSLGDLRPGALPAAAPGPAAAVREAALRYQSAHEVAGSFEREPASPPGASREAPPLPTLVDAMQRAAPESAGRREAVPLAQFRDSYIVAEDLQGLVLVDQHAAHERVLFEAYLADAEANRVEVQQLMFPVTVELSPADAAVLEQETHELRRLGFQVEPFGADAVRIDAVPAVAAELDPEAVFRELLGEAGKVKAAASDVDGLRHRLVTTAACHAAIKVNHRLDREAMQVLLDRLYATANPTTCPHGRPILFRMTLDEIERAFRRR